MLTGHSPTCHMGAGLLSWLSFQQRKRNRSQTHHAKNDQLRGAMAGAKILYQTADSLNLTTSYRTGARNACLMLASKGFPVRAARMVRRLALLLLFDDNENEQRLRIIASRTLDRRDHRSNIAGEAVSSPKHFKLAKR